MDNQNEIFVIVNEQDKILGYRPRYQCHHDKNLIHRSVGVIIFNDRGEILLQKRSMTKDTDPGLYTISVSGHVEKGETYKQAAKRELLEEIGIHTKLKFAKRFIVKMKTETEMEALYTAEHNGPFKINRNEIDEVRFFSLEQIKNMVSQFATFTIENFKQMSIIRKS
jgi:isopentenyl-diphosphate delta-isomerase type 1